MYVYPPFTSKINFAPNSKPFLLSPFIFPHTFSSKNLVFGQTFEPLAAFNVYKIPDDYGLLHPLGRVRGIKSVCVDKFNRKILYGTSAGEIGEIDFVTGC